MENDAEGLQQLTGHGGFELAGDGRLAFGKLVLEFVGLVAPASAVSLHHDGDEPNPLSFAGTLCTQVVALKIFVRLRGASAILGRLVHHIPAKAACDSKVEGVLLTGNSCHLEFSVPVAAASAP